MMRSLRHFRAFFLLRVLPKVTSGKTFFTLTLEVALYVGWGFYIWSWSFKPPL